MFIEIDTAAVDFERLGEWLLIPLIDFVLLCAWLMLLRGVSVTRRTRTAIAVAVVGAAILVSALALGDSGTWRGFWWGAGMSLVVATTAALAWQAPHARAGLSTGIRAWGRLAIGTAVLIAAGLAIAVEILGPDSFAAAGVDHPVTVQVLTSVAVLFATYVVIDQVVASRGSERWVGAAQLGLADIRRAANLIDGRILKLCLDTAHRSGGDPPRVDHASRRERDAFVSAWMEPTFAAPDTYSGNPSVGTLMKEDVTDLEQEFARWSALLVLNRSLHDIANGLPQVVRHARDLVAIVEVRERDPATRTDQKRVVELAVAVKRYQQARHYTVRAIDRELDG